MSPVAEESGSAVAGRGGAMARRPLLLTGAPRSGTTWAGQMLAASGKYYYLHEPFNPTSGVGRDVIGVKPQRYMQYICDSNGEVYREAIRGMLAGEFGWWRDMKGLNRKKVRDIISRSAQFRCYRQQGIRPLVKDPIAIMSSRWLAENFDLDILIMVRHPAAFVASMKRMNWSFNPDNWALSQPDLLSDYLSPLKEELEEARRREGDIVFRLSVMWKTINYVVLQWREQYGDRWLFYLHEDISRDPVAMFREIFDRLGIEWDDEIERVIVDHTSPDNPDKAEGRNKTFALNSRQNAYSWQARLSRDEVSKIRGVVEDVSRHFYSAQTWEY